MARYIALADGLVGTHYIREGEAFEYAGPAPSWARPADQAPSAKKKAEGGKKAGK